MTFARAEDFDRLIRLVEHRKIQVLSGPERRFEGTVAEARETLPMQALYLPRHDDPGIRRLLPADAEQEGAGWRFAVPAEGAEPMIQQLIQAGYGLEGLSIDRPGLHEAFVNIVGADAARPAEEQAV